jgi:type I restriction enzyme S subunit
MEVKPGYKQTEVGVIPQDWDTRPCSSVSDLITVGIVIRPTQYYVTQGVPALRSANIREDRISDCDMVFISEKANALLSKSKLQAGDVVTVRTGYPGTSAVVPKCFAGANCIDILITRPSKAVSSRYLSAWINSSFGRYQILRNQGGLAQQHFNVGDLRTLVVALPRSKAEQEAIAEALSDVDALIGALDRLITKNRDLKQAAMQQLLTGQTRLPGFKGEWEVKTLQESTECLDSVRVPLNEAQRAQRKGDYPYCGANGVLDYVNSYVIDDDIILMAEDGGYFDEYEHRPIAYRMSGKCWVNNHAHILKARLGFDQGFVFYSLVHKNILPFLASGTRAKLNKSEMNKINVRVPQELSEQTAIAEVLSDMDAEIAALEQRRDKTRALKQGMMQELLTGQTRLI